MGWEHLLGYMFSSLFTQHKVGKGKIFMTALQKDRLNPDNDEEIVDNVLLLISKGSMKQIRTKLDFKKDIVTLKKSQTTKLMCTSSGPYCLSLSRNFDVIRLLQYHT